MSSIFRRHALRNIVHSALLIASMMMLCAVIGWLVGGSASLLGLTIVTIFILLIGPGTSPQLLLKMYGARPVQAYEAPELIGIMRELAAKAELSHVPSLQYIPSPIANAFAVGTHENGAIAITGGLLRALDAREIRAIIAHEMSHLRSNDGWVMSLADSISQIVRIMSLVGQILLVFNLPLFLLGAVQIPWILILVLVCAPTLSALLQLALSRTREYEADLESARLTGDPSGLASGLVKIEDQSLSWFERVFMPGRRMSQPSLLRTHPPTQERLRRLRELEEEMNSERAVRQRAWPDELISGGQGRGYQPHWHVSRF